MSAFKEIALIGSTATAELCDRCPASARYEVTTRGGGKLAFCGHHAAQNSAAFVTREYKIRELAGHGADHMIGPFRPPPCREGLPQSAKPEGG